jgi:hypothetical protein
LCIFTKIVTSRTSKHKRIPFWKGKNINYRKKLRDPNKYSIKSQSGTVIGQYLHGNNKNGMELISFCTFLFVQPYFLMECIWRGFSCCRRYVQRSNSSERTKSPEKTELCCTEITYAQDEKSNIMISRSDS